MQFLGVATVKFAMRRNCFITAPKNWAVLGEAPVHLMLQSSSGAFKQYVTWAGELSLDLDTIELNEIYAEKLGFTDNSQVIVERLQMSLPNCQKAIFNPTSEDHWDIMELNLREIENSMINQIKIISKGSVFPLWANKQRFIVLVQSTLPDDNSVVLTDGTEITIIYNKGPNPVNSFCKNIARNSSNTMISSSGKALGALKANPQKEVTTNSILNNLLRNLAIMTQSASPTEASKDFEMNECLNEPLEMTLRVDSLSRLFPKEAVSPTDVYISEQSLLPHFGNANLIPKTFIVVISKVLSPAERLKKLAIDAPSKQAISRNKMNSSHSSQDNQTKEVLKSEVTPDVLNFESAVVRVNVQLLKGLNGSLDLESYLSAETIYLSNSLQKQLGLEVTACVCLRSVHYPFSKISSLELQPVKSLDVNAALKETILKAFSTLLKQFNNVNPMVMSLGTLFHLANYNKDFESDFVVGSFAVTNSNTSTETKEKYFYASSSLLKECQINVGSKIPHVFKSWDVHLPCKSITEIEPKPVGVKIEILGGIGDIACKIEAAMEFSLCLTQLASKFSVSPSGRNYLLHGAKGIGKSVVARAICQSLCDSKFSVHTQIVECKQLRGKRVDSIKKTWEEACSEAVHRRPSVILFDDLDAVASATNRPEQEASPDSIYFNKVAEAFISVMRSLEALHVKVSVLATSKSIKSLQPLLTHSSGKHVFLSTFKLAPPNLTQREEILEALIRKKSHVSPETLKTVNLQKVAEQTDGYVAQDLVSIVDKAIHTHALKTSEDVFFGDSVVLDENDFTIAIKEFTPNCLHGLSLHIENNHEWKDVGGLAPIKQALQQTLTWPLKYPKLFAACSLRPQSGVLLYGAPGTGKTLLASVVASECGHNFISIKGPELLSKYIGASEQAIREVFNRAQSAKPCIIFFDEFDSIAPRRGHDSTGVTDRVVNQLLTQLDGVESLIGVSVLAATSRPDLIDPALLRPGRFDKCLHCPLPDESERSEILLSLSRKLSLDPDVDLKVVAQATENFSGADLQALLYSAQLNALNETLTKTASAKRKKNLSENAKSDGIIVFPTILSDREKLTPEKRRSLMEEASLMASSVGHVTFVEGEDDRILRRKSSSYSPVLIMQSHIDAALLDTKPSVSEKERNRYSAIYEMFRLSRSGKLSSHSVLTSEQRVTLA